LVTDEANDTIHLEVDGTTPGFSQDRSNGIVAPGAAVMADLNGDGIDDLIVANSGGNEYPRLPLGWEQMNSRAAGLLHRHRSGGRGSGRSHRRRAVPMSS